MTYMSMLNNEVKKFFDILCNHNYPEFLDAYMECEEVQRLRHIGCFDGSHYTKMCDVPYWYSKLDHSIAVSLVTWHLTKDKSMTLAAFFQNSNVPIFGVCGTLAMSSYDENAFPSSHEAILKSSKRVIKQLKIDGIDMADIIDVSFYPVLENGETKLSINQLVDIFESALILEHNCDIDTIEDIYKDIKIMKNEVGEEELGFSHQEVAEDFFQMVYNFSIHMQKNELQFTHTFITDLLKELLMKKEVVWEDFYHLSEEEVIELICKDKERKDRWNKFYRIRHLKRSDETVEGYSIRFVPYSKYVIPLCRTNMKVSRLNEVSSKCQKKLDKLVKFEDSRYGYL